MDKPVDHLKEVLEKNIDYFRMEYSLSYAECIGVLEMIKLDIYKECIEE